MLNTQFQCIHAFVHILTSQIYGISCVWVCVRVCMYNTQMHVLSSPEPGYVCPLAPMSPIRGFPACDSSFARICLMATSAQFQTPLASSNCCESFQGRPARFVSTCGPFSTCPEINLVGSSVWTISVIMACCAAKPGVNLHGLKAA